jgi:hypothetical protein
LVDDVPGGHQEGEDVALGCEEAAEVFDGLPFAVALAGAGFVARDLDFGGVIRPGHAAALLPQAQIHLLFGRIGLPTHVKTLLAAAAADIKHAGNGSCLLNDGGVESVAAAGANRIPGAPHIRSRLSIGCRLPLFIDGAWPAGGRFVRH